MKEIKEIEDAVIVVGAGESIPGISPKKQKELVEKLEKRKKQAKVTEDETYMRELKERLALVLDKLGLKTQMEQSKVFGVGQSQVSAYLNVNAKAKPTMTAILTFLNKFSEINAEWLMRGKGSIMSNGDDADESESVPEKEVLLIPAGARGGSLDHFQKQVGLNAYNSEVIKTPFINADIAATVKDDHMAPDYPAGTVLCLKKQIINVIEWGQCYYIDTVDGSKFYMLQPSDKGDEYIKCVSLNTTNDRYKPFDLNVKYITALYKIVGSIKW